MAGRNRRFGAATASTGASRSAAAAWICLDERPFVLNHGVDVTEQHEAEEALHLATRQRELILESVGDGIYGIDLEGRLTFINEAGARAARLPAGRAHRARDLHDIIHHSHADGTPYSRITSPILQGMRRQEAVRMRDEVFWRADGSSHSRGIHRQPAALKMASLPAWWWPSRTSVGAPAPGKNEGRVHFHGEPRAAHAAHFAARFAGADFLGDSGQAAGETAADGGDGDRQLRPAGAPGERHPGFRQGGEGAAAAAASAGGGSGPTAPRGGYCADGRQPGAHAASASRRCPHW